MKRTNSKTIAHLLVAAAGVALLVIGAREWGSEVGRFRLSAGAFLLLVSIPKMGHLLFTQPLDRFLDGAITAVRGLRRPGDLPRMVHVVCGLWVVYGAVVVGGWIYHGWWLGVVAPELFHKVIWWPAVLYIPALAGLLAASMLMGKEAKNWAFGLAISLTILAYRVAYLIPSVRAWILGTPYLPWWIEDILCAAIELGLSAYLLVVLLACRRYWIVDSDEEPASRSCGHPFRRRILFLGCFLLLGFPAALVSIPFASFFNQKSLSRLYPQALLATDGGLFRVRDYWRWRPKNRTEAQRQIPTLIKLQREEAADHLSRVLGHAILDGDEELFEYMLSIGVDRYRTEFNHYRTGVSQADSHYCRTLLERGWHRPGRPASPGSVYSRIDWAVIAAIYSCRLDHLRLFEEKGHTTAINYRGRSPLHLLCGPRSARTGNLKTAKYYVEEKKVDPNLQDPRGDTAIHYCAKERNRTLLKYLLSVRARVNVLNSSGRTPLDLAMETVIEDWMLESDVKRVDPEIVEQLRKVGAKTAAELEKGK